jgi:hypothetical protein
MTAYASPVALSVSRRQALARSTVAAIAGAVVLAALAAAGVAAALLLPRSTTPPNTTLWTPISTTISPSSQHHG